MLDALISAGSSILGGIFGSNEADANRKAQEKYAKNSIQWRVADAKKAGIHPLAALGATGASYTPVSSGFGDAISQAGSAMGEAVRRSSEKPQKDAMNRLNTEMVRSNIEVNQAQRDLLKMQALNIAADARNKATGSVGGLRPDGSLKNPYPLHVWVKNEDGKLVKQLNPDIQGDFGEKLATYGENLVGRAVQYWWPEKQKKPLELTVYGNHAKGK